MGTQRTNSNPHTYMIFVGVGVAELEETYYTSDPLEAVSIWMDGQAKYPTCCNIVCCAEFIRDEDGKPTRERHAIADANAIRRAVLALDTPEEFLSHQVSHYTDKLLNDVRRGPYSSNSASCYPFTYG